MGALPRAYNPQRATPGHRCELPLRQPLAKNFEVGAAVRNFDLTIIRPLRWRDFGPRRSTAFPPNVHRASPDRGDRPFGDSVGAGFLSVQ